MVETLQVPKWLIFKVIRYGVVAALTYAWVLYDEFPACSGALDCAPEVAWLALYGLLYGLYWPIYWLVVLL